jgi:beta-lactamase class A
LDRRTFVVSTVAFAVSSPTRAADDPIATLEQRYGGRLGVAVLDPATGRRMSHRGDERFPMCSTFKLLAVAGVLHKVDKGQVHLDHWIAFGSGDLLDYAPITKKQVGEGGMTLDGLCAAAIEYGDNTAANLILKSLDGPDGATQYIRAIGDTVTRIDRYEPDANTCIPGDPRDTTTPSAMLADLNALTVGNALSPDSQARFLGWLNNCKTAAARIPAGLPEGWTSGDKTGSGDNGTANDIAVVQRPNKRPLLIAAFSTESSATADERDLLLAEVGRIVARQFGGA